MKPEHIERLFKRIAVGGPDECWLWQSKSPAQKWNYGSILIEGKHYRPHRLVMEIKLGRPIQAGMLVRHTCDTPGCCNPNHLVEGTSLQNTRDTIDRGRRRTSGKPKGVADSDLRGRLYSRIRVAGPDDCWEWTGATANKGYGYLKVNGRIARAHRVALGLSQGRDIPAGVLVRHTCDNPPCCNPAHLVEGTFQDNVADAVERGRLRRGSSSPVAKLTEQAISDIRTRYAAGGISQRQLAQDYGVSVGAISHAVRGSCWAHVDGPTNPFADRMTAAKVEEIRRRHIEGGETCGALAKEFEMSVTGICGIVCGQTWGHVGGPTRTSRSRAPLTEEQVNRIRMRYANEEIEQDQLAAEEGVAQSVVSNIVAGRSYKHMPGPITKGKRDLNGNRNPAAKLNMQKAAEIRELYALGQSTPVIARMYGVSSAAVWFIVTGKHWKSADGPITETR